MAASANLKAQGITLQPAPTPVGSYLPAVRSGKLVFTAGQLPTRDGAMLCSGKVPADVSLADAQQAARQAVLNALSAVVTITGSVDEIARVVRLNCFVNSSAQFTDQAQVANGASDLLMEVFGDAGRHSRCAIGAAELPRNAPVELDLVVEIR